MKKMFRTLGLLGVSALVFASCGGNKEEVKPLSGEWTILQVNDKDMVAEREAFLGFNMTDSTFYGCGGCNNLLGQLAFEENNPQSLAVKYVGSTQMFCANSDMEQEVLAAVNAIASFNYLDDEKAELLDKDGNVLMVITPKTSETK